MPASDFTPTVEEIGTRLAARTVNRQTGKREGKFTNNTYPTASQVAELIVDGVDSVSAALGEEIEEEYWSKAKTAVNLYTCMAIEGGYFPESAAHTDSAYTAFRQRYEDIIKNIETALNQKRPNERRIVSLRMDSGVGFGNIGRQDPFANELFP